MPRKLIDLVGGVGKMLHALAQLDRCSAAFVLAHSVQPLDGVFQRRDHLLFQLVCGIAVDGGIQRSGQLQHRVQVGLGAYAEFFCHRAEGLQVSAD